MRKDMKFLFQGDSITEGKWGRDHDPNHIFGHGYVSFIVGELANRYVDLDPKCYNRAVAGDTAYDLHLRWQQDALDIEPDVLSILCGVNDNEMHLAKTSERDAAVVAECSPERFEYHYRAIVEKSREQNPDMVIMLGIPFRFDVETVDERFHSDGDEKERAFIHYIRGLIKNRKIDPVERQETLEARCRSIRKIAADYDAVLVDYQALFEEAFKLAPKHYWIWDGMHPTYAMHWRMAKEWLRVWDSLEK